VGNIEEYPSMSSLIFMKFFDWFKNCHHSFRGLVGLYGGTIALLLINPIKSELEWLNHLCAVALVLYCCVLSGLILKNKTGFKSKYIGILLRVLFSLWSVMIGLGTLLALLVFGGTERDATLIHVYGRSGKVYEIYETPSGGKIGPLGCRRVTQYWRVFPGLLIFQRDLRSGDYPQDDRCYETWKRGGPTPIGPLKNKLENQ
jgi:hypothetical protein